MSKEHKSPVFKKWLDVLQQESWQLELIISGFALYALFTAFEPLEIARARAVALEHNYEDTILVFTLLSVMVLILNLTVHVILRGLWIGAIGLRYVSGEIDYKQLKYAPKFNIFLRKRVGSFDKFIADLERYCSIIFGITFLLVFYLLAIFITFGLFFLVLSPLGKSEPSIGLKIIVAFFSLLYFWGALLTFIDFITQGFLKKKKWLARIYYPFYRFFSILSLSFIYRPIVYNLLDNKFGRRVAFGLVPIYVGIFLISTLEQRPSNIIPISLENRFMQLDHFSEIASPIYYENDLDEGQFVHTASIQSKIIREPYIDLFVAFKKKIEDDIFLNCKELKPEIDQRGIETTMFRSERLSVQERKTLLKSYLRCFSEINSITIDSINYSGDFLLAENKNDQKGFEAVLPIDHLKKGNHLLTLKRRTSIKKDSIGQRTIVNIPFWYYPE
ncbi:hypothetical protein ACFQ1M_03155 [Sungkyunkwania multivorans]|uniref:Uncharacterized protein n=1 Tax=Sungkyunkwania multivorans TaxID=1173618 RepID=A0ABW3CTW3_9FLAO